MDNSEKIAALEWALLPPEEWDEYDETLSIEHRTTLTNMLDELKGYPCEYCGGLHKYCPEMEP